jgi:hypothetical protein
MADNFTANAGSGGATFAADDIAGVHHPRVKVEHGVDGAAVDASNTNPLPVAAYAESSAIAVAGAPLTVKFAAIAASSSGNNTLVAAVTSKKIRVVSVVFVANGSVNGKFQTGAGGTDLTGLFYMVANSGAALPFNPAGWFETGSGALLNLNLSGAVAVGGCISYIEV